jgi:hypothetical protein
MARSLTVQHEENVSTTPLLNGFLVFAALVMLLSALSWDAGAIDAHVIDASKAPAERP